MSKAQIAKLFWGQLCCNPLRINPYDFEYIVYTNCSSCSDYLEGDSFESFDFSNEYVFDDGSKLIFQYNLDSEDGNEIVCEVVGEQ